MPNPFFVFLNKKHVVKKFTSYQNTEQTKELQLLVASGNKAQYRKREQELNEEGYKFRLTKGVVYEIRDEGEKIEVRVAVQVKGFTLTWYFWAPDGLINTLKNSEINYIMLQRRLIKKLMMDAIYILEVVMTSMVS